MTELLGAISCVLSVFGVLLNNRRLRFCFIVWIVSNLLSFIVHYQAGVFSLAIRDLIFFVLAIEGWNLWRKNDV